MAAQELKLKQASAVLGVTPKDLQNFVQAGVLRPRRRGATRYFDRKALVIAKVAICLKDSLGTSTRYLSRFTNAVATVPGFASGAAKTVRLRSGNGDEQPIFILIPLCMLVAELDERLPLADQAKDLPRGRKRAGWKDELRVAFQDGAVGLEGISASDVARTIKAYRRGRKKTEPTVVAEAVEATA